MRKIIHKLREKEQHQKEKIAMIGAFMATIFILLFYIIGVSALNNADESQLANTKKPVDNLMGDISNFVSELKNVAN